MRNSINWSLPHSNTQKEDKISSQLLIVTLTILSNVYTQVKFSVMQKEISCKNVMKNTLFLNHIKEVQNQVREETCMQFFQLGSQLMDLEGIHLLATLENLFKLTNMDHIIKTENSILINLRSIVEQSPEHHFTFLFATKIVQTKTICLESVSNGWLRMLMKMKFLNGKNIGIKFSSIYKEIEIHS